jgi:hydroxypyruvate isomerase
VKFSVCTDSIFGSMNTADAIKTVGALGYSAVEFWSWWDKDIRSINRSRLDNRVDISAICTRFVSLTDRSKKKEYIQGLRETIETAKILDCRCIISQVGNDTGEAFEVQKENIQEGLAECIPLLENQEITLVIEPLNTVIDHKGYFLWSSDVAADIVGEAASPCIKMLFDYYHQQIMEGDILRRSLKLLDKIGHVHAAGNPGRHELDHGEIEYKEMLKKLAAAGYQGYIGLEYFPAKDPIIGLKKLREW